MGLVRQALASVRMRWSRPSWQAYLSTAGRVDYRREVGDTYGHSTVMAPLLWVGRNFPEAPPRVLAVLDDGQLEPIVRHPMVSLLRNPNGFYSGPVMWTATVMDYQAGGNAYWIKIRDRQRRLAELWWVPSWMIRPDGPTDGSAYLTHYVYSPGGQAFDVPVGDVVHFRFGLDPNDPRLGLSPLGSVIREMYTDQEAAAFTAALMRNMGVPGLLITPEQGMIDGPEADRVKRYVQAHFTGDRRGETLVMGAPTKVEHFGFSPEQLTLTNLRRIPEERVSAVLGVPAVVAGLGAGLDRSTFTNMAEAREMAWESNLAPSQRFIAEDLRLQLLPEFEADPDAFEVDFDLSRVRVLAEDRDAHARRVTAIVNGGLASLAEGRRDLGLRVGPEHEVFYRPGNVVAVAPQDLVATGTDAMRDAELRALIALTASRAGLALQYGSIDEGTVGELVVSPNGNGDS